MVRKGGGDLVCGPPWTKKKKATQGKRGKGAIYGDMQNGHSNGRHTNDDVRQGGTTKHERGGRTISKRVCCGGGQIITGRRWAGEEKERLMRIRNQWGKKQGGILRKRGGPLVIGKKKRG